MHNEIKNNLILNGKNVFKIVFFVNVFSSVIIFGSCLADILRTDRQTEPEIVRNQKACDAEGLSNYNKLAKTGGHKSESC